MKKTDEISSTEKLLHVIRNRNETSLKESREANDDFIDQEFKPSLYTIVPFKKKITLSIIVGSHDLMLVLISRISDQDWSLLDQKRVVFSPEMKKDYKPFSIFLRSSIIQFLEGRKPDYIWSTIPSAKIETRFLTIPKVPSNQIPKVAYFSFNKINPTNGEDLIFDFEILGEVSRVVLRNYSCLPILLFQRKLKIFGNCLPESVYPLPAFPLYRLQCRTCSEASFWATCR